MADLSLSLSFEDFHVRVVGTIDYPEWVASDVCNILGLDTSLAVNGRPDRPNSGLDDDEKGTALVSTPGGMQKMLTVNLKGLKRLVSRSRSLKAPQMARALGFEVFLSTKEQSTLNVIYNAFSHYNPIHQYSVEPYRVDLYFPTLRIVVECDEHGHDRYNSTLEAYRQKYIQKKLGCVFVRFNPDSLDFCVGKVINEILTTIEGQRYEQLAMS